MEAALSKAAPDCCFKHVSENLSFYAVKGNITDSDFAAFFCESSA